MSLHIRLFFFLTLLFGLSLAKPFSQLHHFNEDLTVEQFADRITEGPEECDDFLNPSDACQHAIKDFISRTEDNTDDFIGISGGKLHWEQQSGCDTLDKEAAASAAFDAYMLASKTIEYASDKKYTPIWNTWMGPNHSDYKDRILSNLRRILDFRPHNKYDIYMSCNDPNNLCNRVIEGRPLLVGGYAWTKKGWFGSYSYINLCRVFFTLDSLTAKTWDIRLSKRHGDDSHTKQAVWQKNQAQYFLHEMMHLNITSIGQPHITDEYVDPDGVGGAAKAYGPPLVYKLAQRSINQGGGAQRASTNADSYAWLANSAYFYREFGEYPLPKNYKTSSADAAGPVVADDLTDEGPVMLHLGDFDQEKVTEEAFSARLNEALLALTPEPESTDKEDQPDPNQHINRPESPECDDTGNNSFSESQANAEIDDLCNNLEQWKDTVIVPPISFGTGATKDGRGKALGIYNEGPTVDGTDMKIWSGVTFAQDGCIGSFSVGGGDTEKEIADCKSYLRTILSGCGGSGGTLKNTCDVWYLKLSANNPADKHWKDLGKIECSDMCADDKCRETLENSPLLDACVCWYSNYNTVTGTFTRVDSGSCNNPDEVNMAYEFPD